MRRQSPSRRVNLLLLVETMEVAGAEQVVASLARGLDCERFHPIVGCLTDPGPLAPDLEDEGITVVALGKRRGPDLRILARLVRTLRRQGVDIVHTHVWPADVWGRVAAKAAGVPVVMMTAHSVDVWKSRPQLLVDRFLSRLSESVVCVSRAVREFYATRAGVAKDKLRVIYNGIDASRFEGGLEPAGAKRSLGVRESAPVLTVVARLLPEKGHRYFLEALARLRRAHPEAVGLIVGDGAARGELEACAETLGLGEGGLRFLGERRDVPELLAATDVVVLPSCLREGLSISLLEAMAAGRPAVVTDIGGNREAVDPGRTGFVVPPGEPEALAEAASRLLSNKSLARSMGQAARAKVHQEFRLERMLRQTEALYEELLERRRKGWEKGAAEASSAKAMTLPGGQS